jgi:hypothetical protein
MSTCGGDEYNIDGGEKESTEATMMGIVIGRAMMV